MATAISRGVSHQFSHTSNHLPILLSTRSTQAFVRKRGKKSFKFESMWVKREDCERTIKEAWDRTLEGDIFSNFLSKIRTCGLGLMKWNKDIIGNIQMKIREMKHRLEDNFSNIGHIMDEAKKLVSSFEEIEITQVRRSRNHVAHSFVREALFAHEPRY
ncbi:hypothetical protein RJ639_000067 [Escallonia herrerae]|uniref:RNase H type-1 domain-containing protein n=1 Tax=Escallonia herrerae TaxID=1293975 RepID=A0AA89BTV2_9ASTE|nr:hypothetical protein RJ639_000067 [Escallonia herrerae]